MQPIDITKIIRNGWVAGSTQTTTCVVKTDKGVTMKDNEHKSKLLSNGVQGASMLLALACEIDRIPTRELRQIAHEIERINNELAAITARPRPINPDQSYWDNQHDEIQSLYDQYENLVAYHGRRAIRQATQLLKGGR